MQRLEQFCVFVRECNYKIFADSKVQVKFIIRKVLKKKEE